MPILFVRHAHAGDRSAWEGDQDERPLSPKGRGQADGLVELLSPYAPARVLSSPARRCSETVGPLAAALGLAVEASDALAEGQTRAAVALVRSYRGESVVLCSHGDVIPHVIETLDREDGVELLTDPGWKKGATWILEPTAGGAWRASYLPPAAFAPD